MCSLNGCSDDEISVKDTLTKEKDTTLCRKCRCENADVLLIGQSGYCKKCFLTAANHKFRANLGKSKLIRRDDSILVDYSGELSSTVLLHLIKAGMSESTHKKLMFKATILYVDDGGIVEANEEKDHARQKIAEEISNSGFDGYTVSLSQVLNKDDLNIKRIDNRETTNENDDQLRAILANLSDNTSRIDLLNYLRRRLLLLAARKLNCNKMLVADTATDIAAKVLGDVCLGRGAQLSDLASFCDARHTDIKILKPLRDFTQHELAYYAQCHMISCVKARKPDVPATSIQALARNFTTNLESQFSSTVSTVFRTAEKLSARGPERQNEEDNCVLCGGILDSAFAADRVSAMRAIEISRLLSTGCVDARISPGDKENGETNCTISRPSNAMRCDDKRECECKDNKSGKNSQVTAEDVCDCLCYSCKLIFRRSDILRTLPEPLLIAAQRRVSLKKMREEIKDFLL